MLAQLLHADRRLDGARPLTDAELLDALLPFYRADLVLAEDDDCVLQAERVHDRDGENVHLRLMLMSKVTTARGTSMFEDHRSGDPSDVLDDPRCRARGWTRRALTALADRIEAAPPPPRFGDGPTLPNP